MDFLERLRSIREEFEAGETPQAIIDVFNRHVEDLLSQNLEEQAVAAGDSATLDLSVWNADSDLPLTKLMGDEYLVLTWFRGNW